MNSNTNSKPPVRKLRPKLKPISPDKLNNNINSSSTFDDDDDGGLGFGDIVTRPGGASASNTPVEESNVEEEEVTDVKETKTGIKSVTLPELKVSAPSPQSTLSVSFGRNVTSSSLPSVNDEQEDVDETISEVDSEESNNRLSSELQSSQQPSTQQQKKQHSATTVNGVDCMKQYSSI